MACVTRQFTLQQVEHMARHYSTRDYFRQMPIGLVAAERVTT